MQLKEALEHKINNKTKPLGSLGLLETLALQVGTIQQTLTPAICKPTIVVFAADHGIAVTNLVNPFPQAVTAQMVLNFLQKGAAINVFTQQNNIDLFIVNAGVKYDFTSVQHPCFINAPINNNGTNNYLEQDAMLLEDARNAIAKGREIVQSISAVGCNSIGFGEMGIGNTSSAALIMSYYLQQPINACVGKGTGVNDEQLLQKINTLELVAAKYQLATTALNAEELLAKIGGYEIAMMVGAYLAAAENNMVILVDGFIATASLLIALAINANVKHNCIFSHCSNEQGHQKMLHHLQVQPLLQLHLRLGEGTGAALAFPLVQNAVAMLNQMASFESAGVSNK